MQSYLSDYDQFKEERSLKFNQYSFSELFPMCQHLFDEIFIASIMLSRVDIMRQMLSLQL
jgi:hypothetical protein